MAIHAWRTPAAEAWAKDFNGPWRSRERAKDRSMDCRGCGADAGHAVAKVSARFRVVERDFSTMRRYWAPTGWADVEVECGICGRRHAAAPPAWALRNRLDMPAGPDLGADGCACGALECPGVVA